MPAAQSLCDRTSRICFQCTYSVCCRHMKSIFRIAIIVCVLLAPSVADCCSCLPITFDEQIASADLVFVGKVVSRVLRKPPGSDPRMAGDETAVHRLAVSRWYKGQVRMDTITVESSAHGSSCGVYMNAGTSCIVYASYKLDYADRYNPIPTDTIVTSLCTRTRLASDTNEIALLESYISNGKVPVTRSGVGERTNRGSR